jgi:excisionase family DNA binding protein
MSQDSDHHREAPAYGVDKSVTHPVDTSPLLTVDQVAERLGTPTRFVRRLIAQRRIGFCRVGRYVRIGANDLADFIEAGRVDPTSTDAYRRDAGSSMQGASPPV